MNIARLGAEGVCETIPVVMQAHQNSLHVGGAGCDVIAFMTGGASSWLSTTLSSPYSAIPSTGGLDNQDHVALVPVAVPIVANGDTSEIEAKSVVMANRFGHGGACEAVIAVLRNHMTHGSSIVGRASVAISSLSRDVGNARWLGMC